jgi:nucleoside-diphosphate-sugar epimerase
MRVADKVVLLTGATGFVGRHVLSTLLRRGARVRVIVRTGSEHLVPDRPELERTLTTHDLFAENVDWWEVACRGTDTIIHVAWYAEPGLYLQSPENLSCLRGTLDLAEGAARAGIRRFVGVGTCAEYDVNTGRLTVDTPLRPATIYAASKAAAFITLSQWFAVHQVEFAWCRLFYLYGAGEDARRLVAYLHAQLAAGRPAQLTSGRQVRDFWNVEDAACRIVDVALGEEQGPVNVCSGVPITVRELAERIADEYGRRDLLCFGALPDNVLDPPVIVGVP